MAEVSFTHTRFDNNDKFIKLTYERKNLILTLENLKSFGSSDKPTGKLIDLLNLYFRYYLVKKLEKKQVKSLEFIGLLFKDNKLSVGLYSKENKEKKKQVLEWFKSQDINQLKEGGLESLAKKGVEQLRSKKLKFFNRWSKNNPTRSKNNNYFLNKFSLEGANINYLVITNKEINGLTNKNIEKFLNSFSTLLPHLRFVNEVTPKSFSLIDFFNAVLFSNNGGLLIKPRVFSKFEKIDIAEQLSVEFQENFWGLKLWLANPPGITDLTMFLQPLINAGSARGMWSISNFSRRWNELFKKKGLIDMCIKNLELSENIYNDLIEFFSEVFKKYYKYDEKLDLRKVVDYSLKAVVFKLWNIILIKAKSKKIYNEFKNFYSNLIQLEKSNISGSIIINKLFDNFSINVSFYKKNELEKFLDEYFVVLLHLIKLMVNNGGFELPNINIRLWKNKSVYSEIAPLIQAATPLGDDKNKLIKEKVLSKDKVSRNWQLNY